MHLVMTFQVVYLLLMPLNLFLQTLYLLLVVLDLIFMVFLQDSQLFFSLLSEVPILFSLLSLSEGPTGFSDGASAGVYALRRARARAEASSL